MTQEDKELLFKDLSARLPYGVKCGALDTQFVLTNISKSGTNDLNWKIPLDKIKPYLHFDYKSLIEKGLALVAPEEMYA